MSKKLFGGHMTMEMKKADSPDERDFHLVDPIAVAIRTRRPDEEGLHDRFAPTDPSPALDVARHPRVARVLRNRKLQFMLILPNQIIFWLVIGIGLLGTVIPGLNFATAITWYLWFCLVFVMMVVVGRAWCAMCPFGGFGEWVQRHSFWNRTRSSIGLGLKMPESVAQYGFLSSVGAFLLLTWIEEYFNIAGPGNPASTSFMVLGIVGSALLFFLVFERRTFCRYVCPLTALIGSVGSMGSVAGFRTRDRDVCLSCQTKDCMRGDADGYGCPWYTWPGSSDSNATCGLCTECYKACPSDNIGLFVQKPLTSVVSPTRRRADVAWSVALLFGLVIYQQVNALGAFVRIDNWLNTHTHFPQYPNPIDYIAGIFGVALLMAAIAAGFEKVFASASPAPVNSPSFLTRTSSFRSYFLPLMYGIIPVVGADYFARQLPKLLLHLPRVVVSVGHLFGSGSTSSSLYNSSLIASNKGIIAVQVAVMVLGTLAAMWTSWKIAGRELVPLNGSRRAVQWSAAGLALVSGVVVAVLYIMMNAAN
ncbi:MAG: 4Fe-4S binding protein [Acidimicrobiaceae bacterium]|nr:4Fe-4S binding protein [Acidimicrobiaceae bacterium]